VGFTLVSSELALGEVWSAMLAKAQQSAGEDGARCRVEGVSRRRRGRGAATHSAGWRDDPRGERDHVARASRRPPCARSMRSTSRLTTRSSRGRSSRRTSGCLPRRSCWGLRRWSRVRFQHAAQRVQSRSRLLEQSWAGRSARSTDCGAFVWLRCGRRVVFFQTAFLSFIPPQSPRVSVLEGRHASGSSPQFACRLARPTTEHDKESCRYHQ
jgi:hypothetical protein